MQTTCPECHERLLGQINRCWKCGAEQVRSPAEETAVANPFARKVDVFNRDDIQTRDFSQSLAIGALVVSATSLLTSRWTSWSCLPALLGLAIGLKSLVISRHNQGRDEASADGRSRVTVFWMVILVILLAGLALLIAAPTAYKDLRWFIDRIAADYFPYR